jgi:hypothetical protein
MEKAILPPAESAQDPRLNDAATKPPDGFGGPGWPRRFKEDAFGKGRPRGAKNKSTIMKEIGSEQHWTKINGKRRRINTIELALLTLTKLAAAGNIQALNAFIDFSEKYQPRPSDRAGYLVVPAPLSDEEFIAMALEGNAKLQPPPGYKDRAMRRNDEGG